MRWLVTLATLALLMLACQPDTTAVQKAKDQQAGWQALQLERRWAGLGIEDMDGDGAITETELFLQLDRYTSLRQNMADDLLDPDAYWRITLRSDFGNSATYIAKGQVEEKDRSRNVKLSFYTQDGALTSLVVPPFWAYSVERILTEDSGVPARALQR